MTNRKFNVGARVALNRPFTHRSTAPSFEVVGVLPSEQGEFRYRLRSADEPFERVAGESQIEAIDAKG
ncbi:hypothetical protein ABLE91_17370 [Aquabacter sp. CN5-332]|uniref:hypothetical protein n=1 Tax=Aquabacter sp. CN5-332 TaxID=3156608 RepID=UPI0032B56D96